MRVLSLRLVGSPIEDAFIYRTSLYCWTFDNCIRVYAIADIEAAANVAEPDLAPLLTYSLFHSRGIGASSPQSAAWRSRFDSESWNIPGLSIELDAEAVPYVQTGVQFDADSLLDLLIFFDRMYIATNGGLFSLETVEPREAEAAVNPRQRVKDACYSAAAGLGTVAASCGPKGLRLLLDEARGRPERRATRKAAPESLRAEIGSSSIVNHRSRSDIQFLSGTVESTPRGRVLTDVQNAEVQYSAVAEQLFHTEDSLGQDVRLDFAIWDNSRLLVFVAGSVFSLSVGIDSTKRSLNRVKPVASYPVGLRRVLSAARAGRVLALEGDDVMAFVAATGIYLESTGPIISSRSYPRSHRYLRTVTATTGTVLYLFGLDANAEPEDQE